MKISLRWTAVLTTVMVYFVRVVMVVVVLGHFLLVSPGRNHILQRFFKGCERVLGVGRLIVWLVKIYWLEKG